MEDCLVLECVNNVSSLKQIYRIHKYIFFIFVTKCRLASRIIIQLFMLGHFVHYETLLFHHWHNPDSFIILIYKAVILFLHVTRKMIVDEMETFTNLR